MQQGGFQNVLPQKGAVPFSGPSPLCLPGPTSSLYASTSTCGGPDLSWQKENAIELTMVSTERLKTRDKTEQETVMQDHSSQQAQP